jgi:hypothetical protein
MLGLELGPNIPTGCAAFTVMWDGGWSEPPCAELGQLSTHDRGGARTAGTCLELGPSAPVGGCASLGTAPGCPYSTTAST